jgi:predicted nucleic acid-binding protein
MRGFAYHRGVPLSSQRVFLDANVMFSAALGGESFTALFAALESGACSLCTSPQCVDEARRNVTKKRPLALERLEALLARVSVTQPPTALVDWSIGKMPEDDGWVLAGALEAGASVLLTGNTKHFGWLMTRDDLPVRVCTVRAWLDQRR